MARVPIPTTPRRKKLSNAERLAQAFSRSARKPGSGNQSRRRFKKAYTQGVKDMNKLDSPRKAAAEDRANRTQNQKALQRRKATRNLPQNRKDIAGGNAKDDAARKRQKREFLPVERNTGPKNNRNRGGGGGGKGGGHNHGGKGKGGKVGKGGKGGKGGGSTGTETVSKDDDLKTARQSVDLELNPQLNALIRQMEQAQGRYQEEKQSINQTADRTTGNLDVIYDRLGQYLQGNQQVGEQAFAQAGQAQNQGFDALLAQLSQTGQGAKSSAQAELERMGLTADTSGIDRDSALLQGLAQINKQSSADALGQSQAGFGNIQALLQGNAQTSGAEHKASALRAALDSIIGAESQYTDTNTELHGQYGDISGSRGAKIQEMLNIIKQNRFEQEMELGQQAFMNRLAQDKFGLDQAQFRLGAKESKAETRLERAKLNLERQKAAQAAADRAADRKLREQQAASKGSGSFRPTGISGAMQVIDRGSKGFQQRKLGDIIRKIQAAGPNSGIDQTNYSGYSDQVDFGRRLLKKYGIDSVANRRLIADALMAYHGKYGGS